jgi:hypothetical protein
MHSLVTPGEKPTSEVNLLQGILVKEAPKATHEPTIKSVVIFILGFVNHIEVAA